MLYSCTSKTAFLFEYLENSKYSWQNNLKKNKKKNYNNANKTNARDIKLKQKKKVLKTAWKEKR